MEYSPQFYQTILDNLYDGVYFVDKDRRITYWNKGAEKITGYSAGDVLGKSCHDRILAHVDMDGHNLCGSDDCPAVSAMRSDTTVERELFLYHKDGHRIRVFTRIIPYKDSSGRMDGSVEIFCMNVPESELNRRLQELEKLALLDPLTKVGNRQYADRAITNQLSELQRYGWSFGILFIDIDHFKEINDTYGHESGDVVLRIVAQTIQSGLRTFNIISRWGGEEFLVLAVNVTEAQLRAIGERLRLLIQNSRVMIKNAPVQVTISLGATIARKEDTAESLLQRADQLMYQSKHQGRNKLTVENPVSSS